MCTAISLQSEENENFFGRTMDFSFSIEPNIYIVSRKYKWNNVINNQPILNKYSFIGIGEEKDGLLGFFDGVNERGFAAATLYFAGYAKYDSKLIYQDKTPIASIDFLHYILSRCEFVEDLEEILDKIYLIGIPDPITNTVAPLHWMATDKSGKSVVIEQTEKGIHLYQNPIGVMANSPDFPWHLTNLRNYIEVSPEQKGETYWQNLPLHSFGQAAGTMLLPGGYTSPERFVRTAYQKSHMNRPKNKAEAIITCFHIMENVSIPKGVVITNRNTYDYTKYTAFMNTNTCEYFIKTYENIQIITAGLWDNYYNSNQVISLGSIKRPITFDKI